MTLGFPEIKREDEVVSTGMSCAKAPAENAPKTPKATRSLSGRLQWTPNDEHAFHCAHFVHTVHQKRSHLVTIGKGREIVPKSPEKRHDSMRKRRNR
jgi:hypothetical protein